MAFNQNSKQNRRNRAIRIAKAEKECKHRPDSDGLTCIYCGAYL